MAVNVIAFPVGIQKNINQYNAGYGNYYAKPWYPETLALKGLIERVAFDQSVYSNDIIRGVLEKLTTVMVELLKSGQPVKWDGLGTFRPTISNNGKVAQSTVDGSVAILDQLIEGVDICFIPENSKGEALTSKKFRELCTFNCVGVIETSATTVTSATGKQRKEYHQTLIPIDTWRANHPANGGGGGEG